MKRITIILALAIGLVSCTNRLIVQDVETGKLEEVYPNGFDDYVQVGDTILVQCGITDLPEVYATGKFSAPESSYGTYVSYNNDTIPYAIYYKEVYVMDKVFR